MSPTTPEANTTASDSGGKVILITPFVGTGFELVNVISRLFGVPVVEIVLCT